MPDKQRWWYAADASTVIEITDRVRLPSVGGDGSPATVGAHAEEGSGESVSIEVDDQDGDLIMLLHRRVYSTSDPAPTGQQVIGNWFIQNLDVVRMDPWSATSRRWLVQMVDENSLLERRLFVGSSSDRPAETDIERILWALTETELNTLSPDVTYIDQTNPVNLDAANYDQQKPKAILEHCKKASGKNYWVKYEEAAATGGDIVSSSVANPTVVTTTGPHGLVTGQQVVIAGHSGSTPTINGTRTVTVTGASTFTIPVNVTVGGTGGTTSTVGRYVLCYFNAATSNLYPSAIALSNVAAEIDSSTVFAISDDTRLNRSGDRAPTSGIVVTHTGGYVYEQDTAVGDTYVYRDVSSPSINVKTAAAATAIAVRELEELATPDDEVETEFYPGWDQVNDAMHGMWLRFRATHLPNYTEEDTLPGYATTTNMRIMRRQVRVRDNGGLPAVRLWLTPTLVPVDVFSILYRTTCEPSSGTPTDVGWDSSGDFPDSGFSSAPTTGPVTVIVGPGDYNRAWSGWESNGTGSLRVQGTCSVSGVPITGDIATVVFYRNGVDVLATESVGPAVGLNDWGVVYPTLTFDTGDFAVVPGDTITATFDWNRAACCMSMPKGAGVQTENMTLTGTLVPA